MNAKFTILKVGEVEFVNLSQLSVFFFGCLGDSSSDDIHSLVPSVDQLVVVSKF